MPSTYRGITVPADADWADIEVAFRSFLDTLMPVGMVLMFGGTTAPAGYLLCNGAAIPTGATYDALRTQVGGANTPDFRGRAPFGPGVSGVVLNAIGGEQTHALTTTEMPSHGHTGTTDSQGNHNHALPSIVGVGTGTNSWGIGTFSSAGQRDYTTDAGGPHTHNVTVTAQGGGGAHNNMPPYRGINFIIKY